MLTIQPIVYIKRQRVQPELCHTSPDTPERDTYNAKLAYVVQFNWEVRTHANSERPEQSFIHRAKHSLIQTNSGVLLEPSLAKWNSSYLKMCLIENNIQFATSKN